MEYRVLRIRSISLARTVCLAAVMAMLVAVASRFPLYAVAAEGAPDGTATPQPTNRFSQFPSPPGKQIDLIRALPDGTWLELGPPAPDPKWGRGRGRAWAANLPVATSLGLAFFYGEGIHGWWDEKTGRYMDDLWAYDINANRWITVYPGTDVRHPPKLHVNKDGFPTLDSGEPIPIGTPVHNYQASTWDPKRKTFLTMEVRDVDYDKSMPSIYAFIQANKNRLNANHASPWIYDTTIDKWRRHATLTPSPETGPGDVLFYIPFMDKVFFRRHDEVWFYDPGGNSWKQVTPGGPALPFGIDAAACYDPKRQRIYIGGGDYPVATGPNAFWIYDIRNNRWIDPKPKGSPGGNRYGADSEEMHYDSASDTVLLFRHSDEQKAIYAYSPETNEWKLVADHLPKRWYAEYGVGGTAGFYDSALNAHFFYVAGDSDDDGTMYVYRYKKAK